MNGPDLIIDSTGVERFGDLLGGEVVVYDRDGSTPIYSASADDIGTERFAQALVTGVERQRPGTGKAFRHQWAKELEKVNREAPYSRCATTTPSSQDGRSHGAYETRAHTIPPLIPRKRISLAQAPQPSNGKHVAAAAAPPPYKAFPVEILPEPIRSYVVNGARVIGCDAAYLALPMLAALAAAIGNSRRIRLKVGWVEACILWCVIIGDSGTMKSPALELAVRPLRRRQERLFKEHEAELAKYKEAVAEWKRMPKEQRGEEPERPATCERVLCGDVTIEAIAERLRCAPRGLLLVRDELAGWIGSFNQYKSRGGGDVGNWLEAHGGRSMLIDRKTGEQRTVYIPRASVGVCGGIQPGTLKRSLTQEFHDNGFCARNLFAYKVAEIALPSEEAAGGRSSRRQPSHCRSRWSSSPRRRRATLSGTEFLAPGPGPRTVLSVVFDTIPTEPASFSV